MMVTRKSVFTGKVHTMDLPITEEQVFSYQKGALVQDAFPQLTSGEREFIMNGVTPEEWEDVIGHPDDDESEEE